MSQTTHSGPVTGIREAADSHKDSCEFGLWSQSSLNRPIVHLYRQYSAYLDTRLAEYRISAAHVPLLCHLWEGGGGETQNEIARDLAVDKATVSRAVAHLVRTGLVVQKVSSRDARAFTVELTEAGTNLCGPVGDVLRGWTQALIGDLPDTEREQLLTCLSGMIGKADELLASLGVRQTKAL